MSLRNNYAKYFSDESVAWEHWTTNMQAFVQLLCDAGWFLYETGQWEAGRELLLTGKGICEFYFAHPASALTALIYNNLGVIHDSQNGADEALACIMKSLSIRERFLSGDDPEMGNSYSSYSHSLVNMGKIEESQEYYQKAIEVHERARVPSSDLLEGAYSCMGKSMLYLDKLNEAAFWIGKALDEHKRFKEPNFFVAETIFALGSLRMKEQRWPEAEVCIRGSLELREKLLGKKARLVGVCLHHLGFIRHHERDDDEAISLLRGAIEIFRVPSETQPGLLQRSMIKLATILDHRNEQHATEESTQLREEVRSHSAAYPVLKDIPMENEKAWNQVVQVAYRCV